MGYPVKLLLGIGPAMLRPSSLTPSPGAMSGPYYQFIQRKGERPQDYDFKAFLCTRDRDEMEDLSRHYPQRWHIEEFFKNDQALGWHRAGTMNLNIRYGQMTMALIAQAACFMMRQRLGSPVDQWDAPHLAKDFFRGLEGTSVCSVIPLWSPIIMPPIPIS